TMSQRPPLSVPSDRSRAKYGTFVMRGRKHAGKTLAQIDLGGDRDYIAWAAGHTDGKGHPDPHVRKVCAAYLESTKAGHIAAAAVTLPLSVVSCPDLTPGAKLLFAVIWTAADQEPDHCCRLGNVELQSRTALSARHVKRMLSELEGMGLIRRLARDAG